MATLRVSALVCSIAVALASPATFAASGVFPAAIEERNGDGVSFASKKSFGRAISMSRDGTYYAVAQPYGFEPFAAPPGLSYVNFGSPDARNQTGTVIVGTSSATRAIVTQRDIVPPGLPAAASFSKGGVVLSADGGAWRHYPRRIVCHCAAHLFASPPPRRRPRRGCAGNGDHLPVQELQDQMRPDFDDFRHERG